MEHRRVLAKDSWRIDPTRSAFVIIDMQRAFVDPGAPRECTGAREIVPRINTLAGECRRLKIPVIFVRHANRRDMSDIGLRRDFRLAQELDDLFEGSPGVAFCDGLEVREEDHVITKVRHSALAPGSSTLERVLRGLGRDTIIVCGVATDVCVGTTIADAMMLDFKVFCVGDLTAAFSEARRAAALSLQDERFARVMSFEQVMEELAGLRARAER